MKIRVNINPDLNLSNIPKRSWLPVSLAAPLRRKGLANRLEEREGEGLLSEKAREKNPNRQTEIMREINNLVGLTEIKTLIHELRAFVKIRNLRGKEGLINEPMALHMIFKGNPGTGKTTIARLIGQLFKELAVLPKGHVVEVERADLVGEYIGHTALKAREQVKKALGGVLFIDEAYSLARGGEKDFGKECIDCLVKAMEDHRDNLILILSGYRAEMDLFLRSNPGIRSRFPIQLEFPDYLTAELLAIAESMVRQRQYEFSGEATLALRNYLLQQEREGHPYRGNARLVRNIIEKAIRRQAVRLVNSGSPPKYGREQLILLAASDIIEACQLQAKISPTGYVPG
ncbi:MAG: AAA family ATPase [Heliobacteriaceae bacterium]|nr:AAA family ATPase [Heliobacteriaceae bacterium]MDD4586772.1 AAA family ATPase [Heliobacteriaceae bacterium]